MDKGGAEPDRGETEPAIARGMSAVNVRAVGKKTKTAVLIAGMYRSGSSAIGRMVSLCGCGLPKTSFATEAGKELGSIITKLNDEILASAGSHRDDWEAFNPDWHDSPVAEEFHERAQAILAGEFGEGRLFAIKDARICRLLPFWLDALRTFGAVAKIVCPIRNPLEVAASLHKTEGIDLGTAQLIWVRHVLDAEAFSRGVKRSFVYYGDLFGSSGIFAQRLGNELGISWPRRSTLANLESEPVVSAPHGPGGVGVVLLDDPSLSPWIKSSFRILHRWTREGARATDGEELDRIRSVFNEAAPAFSRSVVLSQQMARRSIMLEEGIARRHVRIGELERAAAQRDAELAVTRLREATAQAQLSALENEIADADAAVAAENERRQALTAEVLSSRKRLAAREHEIRIKQEELARASRHIGQLEAAAAARDRELSGRAAALDTVLKARESENAELRQAITERDIQIAVLDKTIVALRTSNSWQVTAPFRVASGMTRWVRSVLGNSILRAPQLLDPITAWRRRSCNWRAIRAIARSNLFDQEWYLKTYRDVAQREMDPIRHYVAFGASEGRNPSALFSTRGYLCSNRDVAAAGMNPLAHFLLHWPGAKNNIRLPATKWKSKRRGVVSAAPQVSIVIPVHNSAKYLSTCLTSLLTQSVERIEIISVDDGSSDDSFSILRAYQDRDTRIKIIRSRTNEGASHARNCGLQCATARYIQFIDSDDILPPGALNTLLGIAESDGVEVVRGSIASFSGNNPQMLSLWNAAPNRRRFQFSDEPRIWIPWGHQSYIFNREFLIHSGITYPDLRDGEDPIFIARVLTAADRISSTAQVVYHYRLRDDQVRSDEDFFKHAEIVRSLFLAAHPPAWLNGYGPFIAEQLRWRVTKKIGVDTIG